MKLRLYLWVVLAFTLWTKSLLADGEISDGDNYDGRQAIDAQEQTNHAQQAFVTISPDEYQTITEASNAILDGGEKLFNESDYCNCFNMTLGITARIKGILGWAPIDFPHDKDEHIRRKITDSELIPFGKRSYVYSAEYQQCGAKEDFKIIAMTWCEEVLSSPGVKAYERNYELSPPEGYGKEVIFECAYYIYPC